jgi:CBS domain containing-hemolysin-like protein
MTAFGKEGSEIALIIALAYIIQVQAAAWYVKFTDRLFGPAPDAQVKDVMLSGVFSLHASDTVQNALRLLAEEHIHSFAVLDEANKPLGMLTTATLLDALADGLSRDTALNKLPLEPALLIPAKAPLKEALAQMKRAHEYKVLVPGPDGSIEHVLTQEEIIRHFAERK